MKSFSAFDAADYLRDEDVIAEYLTAALEDANPEVFLTAVRDVARARGMAELARNVGVGRESLYKALAPGAKPRYDTVLKVMKGFGVTLSAQPVQETSKYGVQKPLIRKPRQEPCPKLAIWATDKRIFVKAASFRPVFLSRDK